MQRKEYAAFPKTTFLVLLPMSADLQTVCDSYLWQIIVVKFVAL